MTPNKKEKDTQSVEERVRKVFLKECPFWSRITPQQCEWIVQFATQLSQEAEERGARRAMEIIEELEEEDTEGIGWDMFFEKEGTEPCCPGDDWGCVYKMALRKIKQAFTNHQ